MSECDLLIRGCQIILPDLTVLDEGAIAITKDKIADIGQLSDIETRYQPKAVLEARDKLAMPGMVDGHTHTVQQFLRGGIVDEYPIVWIRILVPYESRLDADDRYQAAMLCCLQMIKAGITTFADSGSGDMEPVIRAVHETGMRAAITRMTRDCGDFIPEIFKDAAPIAVRKTEDLYRQFHDSADGRVRIWFSVTSPMTTSPELAELVAAAAKEYNTGIHIHLAEHLREVEHCLVNYRLRPAEYLDAHGILGPNLLAAHAVQLADREVKLLAERQVKVIHCPIANLTNQGFTKTPLMKALGTCIGLGNDGAHTADLDLFGAMRILKCAMQARHGLPIFDPRALPVPDLFRMVTIDGARALLWDEEIGSLEKGKKADIVLLNWRQPHFYPTRSVLQTLVMVASPRDVSDVIIDGRLVLKDREFTYLDEEAIMAAAGKQMRKILGRKE
ncbi:MAG: amidohydrolase [Chloroflexi bacterium]|nr:amidohydrolase [Chloroflexota bacterium]MCL5075679.1 amidohydrolase [Chloroflexota bacterium]